MGNKSYERLAAALEALPNGFPRTPSRVELRLLKKAFTEEEAELAGLMSRKYESVSELATRVGLRETRVREVLQGLLPRALVRVRVVHEQEQYRLGPFVVGWYETMMKGQMRNDREFAELFEQCMREGGGEQIMSPRPGVLGVLGVVPAREAEDLDLFAVRCLHYSLTME